MLVLSAFADEISPEVDEQAAVLVECGIGYVDVRGAWDANVLELSAEQLRAVGERFGGRGLKVAAIASPIGKSSIDRSPSYELERLKRACDIAQMLGAGMIRVFSFYPPEDLRRDTPIAAHRTEVLDRMRAWVEWVARNHPALTLVHENEADIYGETPSRCADLMDQLHGPRFSACYDFANWVHAGYTDVFETCWGPMKSYTTCFHLKDYRNGASVPCGEGDGEVAAILSDAVGSGFDGFMSLEPHLKQAGRFSGYSGPGLFRRAVEAALSVCRERKIPLHR